jgi:hypothetical protein
MKVWIGAANCGNLWADVIAFGCKGLLEEKIAWAIGQLHKNKPLALSPLLRWGSRF